MPKALGSVAVLLCAYCATPAIVAQDQTFNGRDALKMALSAADRSTLDQKKTHPFHLVASVAPSLDRDRGTGWTGEFEIWWKAPGIYRRELRAASFHMIEIVNEGKVWQQIEGEYLPYWLDTISDALLHPLPVASLARRGIAPDQGKAMFGSSYLNWEKPLPMDMQPAKESVAVTQATGLLFYDGGLGWGALFKDYQDFHGRQVAHTVSAGSPEVTAKVSTMEDLHPVSDGWFDAAQSGSTASPLRFVAVGRTNLAQDVMGGPPALTWPDPPNTRADGVIWANLIVDNEGRIREPFTTISDNPALNEFTHDYLSRLQFKPVLMNGQPVQSVRHVVLHFNLGKPANLDLPLPGAGPV